MSKPIGLITGNGKLPIVVAEAVRKEGLEVVVCATIGETDSEIAQLARFTEWVRLGQLGKIVKCFKRENVEKAVMVGKITKTNLFKGEILPDLEMIKVLGTRKNNSDDSLLGGIADYLTHKGIEVVDSTTFLDEEFLPKAGVLTKRKPSQEDTKDIEYGWFLAKEMGRLDVGQTVVVKKQAVLAVEAIEGTDEVIRRGAMLGQEDVCVVKVAKPNQDMRFDVPAVGLTTLDTMIKSGAKTLTFEAGKTIVLDRAELIERANKNKITIVAKDSSENKKSKIITQDHQTKN